MEGERDQLDPVPRKERQLHRAPSYKSYWGQRASSLKLVSGLIPAGSRTSSSATSRMESVLLRVALVTSEGEQVGLFLHST